MLRPGQAIILCALALLTLGVIMVNSADMNLDPAGAITLKSILLSRSTAYLVLAMLAMWVCSVLPVRRFADAVSRPVPALAGRTVGLRELIGPLSLWACVLVLLGVLATVYLPVVGSSKNGSHRWVEGALPGIGRISVQPSELAKWGLVLLMAWYGARHSPRMDRFFTGLLPGLAGAGVIAAFVLLEDLGTAVLLGMVACVVLLAAGARVRQLALLMPPALGVFIAAVVTSEYRVRRLTAFLDPFQDPERTGFHMIQSMTAVANGQVFGRGLGHGLQKFGYLPEDRTDFLFAVICEELGVVGAAAVVALYAGLLWAGFSILMRERSPMLKLVALGVLTTIGLQAVINLAVVTGLGPTKGIALPMLSAGGTGWILTAASLGLLVAMDRSAVAAPADGPDAADALLAAQDESAPSVVVTHAGAQGAGLLG